MSEDIHFDNHIKEELSNYTPVVPPHVWDNIVAARKKKRPVGIWGQFFRRRNLLLLLLIVGAAAYWLPRQEDKVSASNGSAAQPDMAAQQIPAAKNTAATAGGSSSTGTTIPNHPATTSPGAATGSSGSPVSADNTGTNSNPDANATAGNMNLPGTNTGGNAAAKLTTDKHAAGSNNQQAAYKNHVYSSLKPSAALVNQSADRNSSRRKAGTFAMQVDGDNAPAGIAPADNSGAAGSAAVDAPPIFLLRSLTGQALKISNAAEQAQLAKRNLRDLLMPECPSVEDDAAGNKRYIDLYAGPDLGLRSFNNFATDTASAAYAQKRKESTRFQSAFSAGVRFTRVFGNGMSLRGGINYSQVNEKFEFVNEKDVRYILIVTPRDIIGPGGVVTTLYDTVRYTETGKRIRTTHNRYRSVDIPLQIGYEFGNGRLHTNISAGAIINLYSWQRGDVLDTAFQPVSITTGKGTGNYGFRSNIGVGFLGSVSLYYKLNSRLHLMAEPYFRYNFQPMTNENLNITQKYNTLGLRLGVRWDLK